VSEVPDHLREAFLESPYLAAKRVFETALSEGVDALLLSGDIVQLDRAGPRAIVFLTEQFRRLTDHGIVVYWAGGQIDPPDAWPPTATLPESVTVFLPAASVILSTSAAARPSRASRELAAVRARPWTTAVFYRDAKRPVHHRCLARHGSVHQGLKAIAVHYMALGGSTAGRPSTNRGHRSLRRYAAGTRPKRDGPVRVHASNR